MDEPCSPILCSSFPDVDAERAFDDEGGELLAVDLARRR